MLKWNEELQAILFSLIGGARYGVKVRLPHAVIMTCLFRNDMNARDKLQQIFNLVREHATNLALFATIYKSILLILKVLSRRCESHYIATCHEKSSDRHFEYLRYFGRTLVSLLGTLFLLKHKLRSILVIRITVISTLLMYRFAYDRNAALLLLVVFGTTAPPTICGHHNDTAIENAPSSSTTVPMAGYPQYSHHALIAGIVGGYTIWGRYSSINYQIVLYLTSRVMVALFKRLTTTTIVQQQHVDAPKSCSTMLSCRQVIKDRIYSLSAATIWGMVMFLFEDSPEFLHPSLRSSMDEIYRHSSRSYR